MTSQLLTHHGYRFPPEIVSHADQYANNRAEVSHQPTRQRERQMRRFKSAAHV